MEPAKTENQTHTTKTSATSPWTDAYQTAPAWSEHSGGQPVPEDDANNSETQSPTQNALSDIYNRGY